MKKNNKLPNIITILILTITTILFWVFINVYWSWTKKPQSTVSNEILIQIDPILDLDTLKLIRERI